MDGNKHISTHHSLYSLSLLFFLFICSFSFVCMFVRLLFYFILFCHSQAASDRFRSIGGSPPDTILPVNLGRVYLQPTLVFCQCRRSLFRCLWLHARGYARYGSKTRGLELGREEDEGVRWGHNASLSRGFQFDEK